MIFVTLWHLLVENDNFLKLKSASTSSIGSNLVDELVLHQVVSEMLDVVLAFPVSRLHVMQLTFLLLW